LTNIPIVTAGGAVLSQHGPVIAILNQYAFVGRGCSIHSLGQLEWYKHVNVRSKKVKCGLQRIKTIDGYIHPINIVNGLAYTSLRPFTDEEWDTLPHVIWTEDADWDPHVLDCSLDDDDDCYDSFPRFLPLIIASLKLVITVIVSLFRIHLLSLHFTSLMLKCFLLMMLMIIFYLQ
jgi:hypothetical protein